MAGQPLPILDEEDWPIEGYWSSERERASQHWYVLFCLLASSIQDRLTGLVLSEAGNLNWAITCRYYAMVHAGRMLALSATGDFPKKHTDLRTLLHIVEQRPDLPVRMDWLGTFVRGERPPWKVRRTVLRAALAELAPIRECEFECLGEALSKLGSLRTDANYEALFMAHERHHVRCTGYFERLDRASEIAVRLSTSIAMKVYRGYLRSSPLLALERESHLRASDREVWSRLQEALGAKFAESPAALRELGIISRELRTDRGDGPPAGIEQAAGIIDRITLDHFHGKVDLFNAIERKVASFETIAQRATELVQTTRALPPVDG